MFARLSFVSAAAVAAMVPAVVSAQLRYDPASAGSQTSYRDLGVIIEQPVQAGDELDFYEEVDGVSGTRNHTSQFTTTDADSGSGTVNFVAEADTNSISVTGSASAVINGTSANVDEMYSTAYTYQQWAFDVAAPTPFTIEGLVNVVDNESGSLAYYSFWEDNTELFDIRIDGDDPTLDWTGPNAYTYTLQANIPYWLVLDVFSYNGLTPGQAGSVSFDMTASVPEPGCAALGAIGVAALLRRRRDQR